MSKASTMVRLTKTQIDQKIRFIKEYRKSGVNAASSSKLDANANVSTKNMATLQAELHKDINIQINREMLRREIEANFGEETATDYITQLESHEIYTHDETSLMPYCVSINMYPFLNDGMLKLGGNSDKPNHLESFCGSFVNLIFSISSQFAGAVASPEFLMYFDYFAKKDLGDNYLEKYSNKIANHLQHVVYALNQPAAARGYQSAFWNLSIFDKFYFDGLFGDFAFPDEEFTKPQWESVSKLQEFFLEWLLGERKKSLLTFPVVTAAMLRDDKTPLDTEFFHFCCENLSKGGSFFIYMNDSVDSLSSCCRLNNVIDDNVFSHSIGAGGVATGSINVMTLNFNRMVQNCVRLYGKYDISFLVDQIRLIQKYQVAYRKVVDEFFDARMLTVYDAGFISLDKQFLTIGINGIVEAAEFLGYEISANEEYINFLKENLGMIKMLNKEAKDLYGYKFNTEFVPAENLGIKNAQWDKKDGYETFRDCYNSYFYIVEDDNVPFLDKFILHGSETAVNLDGGSAFHFNMLDLPSKEQFIKLLCIMAETGCPFLATNVKWTVCKDCQMITPYTVHSCPTCSSVNVGYATRVIGYLKEISSFSAGRIKEEGIRAYHN